MKTTNNKHIINDKLQGVDLPDMNASWQKMDKTLDAAGGVHSGWSVFVAKYKIYLNIFIAVTTIGLVGLFVKSKTIQTTLDGDTVSLVSDKSLYTPSFMSFNPTINHENDLPVPNGPIVQNHFNQVDQVNHSLSSNDLITTDTFEDNLSKPNEESAAKVEVPDAPADTMVEKIKTIAPFIHKNQHNLDPIIYVHNQVGIKIQSGVLPDISLQNAIQTTGFAVYARRFVTPRSAVHVEIGYNPIAIRPITYVEKYNVFNNVNYTQTDSAVVNRLRYVTIPVNWYCQIRPEISLSVGPQISFLTGLSGDLTKKLNYPNAPETSSEISDISIKNRGGFKTTDFGINLGLSWHTGPYEIGAQIQTSFGDYTADRLSPQTHKFSTLQLKAACLLSK